MAFSVCVTGGSSGIGRAVAEEYAADGAIVFINYHSNDSAAEETAESVRGLGGQAVIIKSDLGAVAGAKDLASSVRENVEHLDLLVHCATATASGHLSDVDPEQLESVVRVNGLGLVHVVRELGDILGRGSSVIYVSSRGARQVLDSYGAVGITKALAEHAVRYLAKELGGKGISVNTLAFGPLDTPAFRQVFTVSSDSRLEAAALANPMGRGLAFSDVTASIRALSGSGVGMIQGQTVTVDGGSSL